MVTLSVYDQQGNEVDKITLDEKVFSDKINASCVYEVINQYRANQRAGLASTKTRGEVSGGGRKPWRQKGTGRARIGSTRSPLWRHGGVVFGPHPRDFSYAVNKQTREAALRQVLSAKALDGRITVIDALQNESGKTKDLIAVLKNLKLGAASRRVLLISDTFDARIRRAARNIGGLAVEPARSVHTYAVLAARNVLITRDGLQTLTKRLSA